MELGAMICVPNEPLCGKCPLRRQCEARRMGKVAKFPVRGEKVAMRSRNFVALIVRRAGAVLVRKRPADVVNGGLWEFPNIEVAQDAEREAFLAGAGLQFEKLGAVKHTITRNRITLQAYSGEANGQARRLARSLAAEWRPISELEDLPFSSAHARLRALLRETGAACPS
jgi:A/G-specific adenine glycosylase